MVALYSDENSLLKGDKSNHLANIYINKDEFKFSKEDNADSKKLFETRYKVASTVKKERLKPYMASSVAYMTAGERQYWQSLFSELFIADLYQYNFYCALDRKQLLSGMHDDLLYYKQQLKHLESFDKPEHAPKPTLWETNNRLLETNIEGHLSPAEWCRHVMGKINTAWNAFLRDSLDELNWYRLYWVWAGGGGGFLGSLLELEPINHWAGHDSASDRLESPGAYCGYASWGLYATRLSLHLSLTAKHVIPNPFMSDVEKEVEWQTRFQAQVEQRYQRVGNDIAWGYVNYASTYWYTTSLSKSLGAWGGFINIALMSWDCLMAYITLSIEDKKFNGSKKAIEGKLHALAKLPDSDAKTRAMFALTQSLNILTINWKYDQKELRFVLYSAIAFIPVMALIFTPMFPVYIPALAVMSLALINQLIFIGCVASVLLTAYESYYCAHLSIDKSVELMAVAIEKMHEIEKLHQMLSHSSDTLAETDLNQLRQYHLEHKRLGHEINYFHEEQSHLKTKMKHSVSCQFAFPAVIFASLFMAFTPAVILVVSSLLVMFATRLMINANAPKERDEFANKEENGGDLLCLTKSEYNTPQKALFTFHQPKPSFNSESKKRVSLGNYGLFSTHHSVDPQAMAGDSLELAMPS